MKEPLTERQQSILDYIEDYQYENGCSPKISEIQTAFAIQSVNGVVKHLRAIEKKGWIERDNTPRGIKLLERAKHKLEANVMQVPIYGSIPAGNPQNLSEYVEDYFPIDMAMMGNQKDVFALFVKGESMIDAGIFEKDVVMCVKREPRVGEVVVALVDGESTLKRLIKTSEGQYILKAENQAYPEIYPHGSLEVQGVVIYVIRQLSSI